MVQVVPVYHGFPLTHYPPLQLLSDMEAARNISRKVHNKADSGPMKIGFVTDYYPGLHKKWFGAEIACKRLMELVNDGSSLKTTIFTSKADYKQYISPNIKEVPVLENYFKHAGLSLKTAVPFDSVAYKYFLKTFKDMKPDIVHLHNIKRMTFAPLIAARHLEIPTVFSIYDNWSFCPENCLVNKDSQLCRKFHGLRCLNCVPVRKKPFVFFRRPIFNYFLQKVNSFAVLTNSERDNFIKNGINSDKIHLLPLPLFSGPAGPKADAGGIVRNSILFVGRIEFGKGLHVLVEALPDVIEKFRDMRLRVIGDHSGNDNYWKAVREKISGLGLNSHVEFLGKKDNVEIADYLGQAHLVVVPEQWGIAWPIFLTEAMSMGKIIVASDIGDIPAFIQHGVTGYLADPKDPGDFSGKIKHALEKRELINNGCIEKINSLCDVRSIRNKLLDIYSDVREHATYH